MPEGITADLQGHTAKARLSALSHHAAKRRLAMTKKWESRTLRGLA
jgi:hypothetical protein